MFEIAIGGLSKNLPEDGSPVKLALQKIMPETGEPKAN